MHIRSLTAVVSLILLAGCQELFAPNVHDADADGIEDALDQCVAAPEVYNKVFDVDGCPDTPDDLYVQVRNDVEAFWAFSFPNAFGRSYIGLSSMVGFTGSAMSPCGTASGPFYCGANQAMYLDRSFMLDQLNGIGDFAPAIIIAHEIGHHLQWQLGLLGAMSIQKELQADCFAGAWARNANQRGFLDSGDVNEAMISLFGVGDQPGVPWFSPTAHGTPQQRQNAFSFGFNGGIC
jgi:predicted metalloprotease